MAYCIEYSEYNPSKHKMVAGPWEDSCLECTFKSSSSSSSSMSGFYACVASKSSLDAGTICVEYELVDISKQTVVLGPFYGMDECHKCGSSSTSMSSSSSSSSGASSSSSSETPPPSGCACLKTQCECCCLKTPMSTPEGVKSIGIPKYVNIDSTQNVICEAVSLDDQESSCYIPPMTSTAPTLEECFGGYKSDGCKSFIQDLAPSIEGPSGKFQVWSSDGCDASGNPINPKFLSHPVSMKISGCENDGEYSGTLTFSESGASVDFGSISFNSCPGQQVGIMNFQGSGTGISWQPRYRREYDDYTLTEEHKVPVTFNGDNGFGTAVNGFALTIKMESEPTCREPDEAGFCGCLDLGLYNVIDVETLPSYEVTPEGEDACKTGRPIDINVVCGRSGPDPEGSQPIAGGVTMYYAPYSGTVPVIDNVAYDTTNLPDPPAGTINVIKIHSASTRNDIRYWTCDHLKFATITDPSKWTSDPDKALTFNWPFNDLYFSKGCPGGDTVNLVPC